MCTEFAYLLNAHPSRSGMKHWNARLYRLWYVALTFDAELTLKPLFFMNRCLAHTINLATQAVIKTYSSSKHYNPSKPGEHEPDTATVDHEGEPIVRDEIGIARAIAVKVSI
jgi:hypothetical protein